MAYSESLAQQVRAILATELSPHVFEEEVEEKKMFGGFYGPRQDDCYSEFRKRSRACHGTHR